MTTVIYISGTPCTGKTTLANRLSDKFDDIFSISINDFVGEHDLILGEDPDKCYKIIDIEGLDEKLNDYIKSNISEGIVLVEGHVSHLCSYCDKCIILRLKPDILKERLESRGYSENKVLENLEAEILDVCSVEAYQKHNNKVNELDTSDLGVDEVLSLVYDIILDKNSFPVGNISFIDYLLND